MNLIERIDHWGHVAPTSPAHVSGGCLLTYGELLRQSDLVAAHLTQGLPGDRSPVAVWGHKEPEMLVGFLGAVKAGHPYIPIDISIPAQRVERIVATAQAKLTLTPEKIAAWVRESISNASPDPSRFVSQEDPYYVIFTSGSTGEPKGVVITLGCLTSFLDWMLAEQTLTCQKETFLNQAPFSFDLSVMDLYLSLATGGTLFSIQREEIANPRLLYRALAGSGVSVWVSTPAFAQMCLVEKAFSVAMLPRARLFLFCGSTLAPEVAAGLLDRFPQAEVWNTYGPTEATVATTSVRVDRAVLARYSPLPVGYPKPDTRIVIMDEDRHLVASGERGEVIIAGPNVSVGYIGRPDLTAHAFFNFEGLRAYHTGDWGRFQDGMLFFEGRMDSQIKLHGHRIELEDVEANLRALPGVQDAVVLPLTKEGQVDSLAAFVILAERPGDTDFEITSRLKTRLAERVPAYMVPRKFHFLETFPMTANGKPDRRKLAEALI